ncbi:MAG: hypothetical protein JW829_11425 [Pirellulales bacterium]|nr:hypothetical protein [Pirellulales bacterium]
MDEDEYLNADENDFETDELEDMDEGPPPPPADHVVHIYEYGKFLRTIEQAFTAEVAEAFASEYNRTAKPYGRFAVAGKEKTRAKKTVPWRNGISSK